MELFEAITWKQYLSVIAIGLVLYYTVVLLKYNKGITGKLLKKKEQQPENSDEDVYTDDEEDEPGEHLQDQQQQNIHSFDELEALVTEIRHSILEKAGKGVSKEDLLVQISTRLTDYGGLRQPAYRIALTNFIVEQSENICGVTFSEEELEEAWGRLPR